MKKILYYATIITFVLQLTSCKSFENRSEVPQTISYKTVFKQELGFQKKEVTGMIYSQDLKSLWLQTKSENEPYLFLLNPETGIITEKVFVRGTSYGWQGISRYNNTLHIGDIGNPKSKRKHIQVYTIVENQIQDQFAAPTIKTFKYPDKSKDAKAMAYHPRLNEFFIFTYDEFKTEVYSVSASSKKGTLKKVGEIDYQKVTDVHLSKDQTELLIVADNEARVIPINPEEDFLTSIENSVPIFQKKLNNCQFQSACFIGDRNDLCLLVYNPIQNKTFYTLEQKEGYN